METYYFVVKNGLYLCFDKRWTDKLCWAIRFDDPEQAEVFAYMKRADVIPIGYDEMAEKMNKEMNNVVKLAMAQFGYSLKNRN